MEFSERLKKLRIDNGLKQNEVASYVGVTAATYNRYEKGLSTPKAESIINLANFFNVTPDYLMVGDTDSLERFEMSIGDRIREKRKELKFTQKELAEKIGKTESTIQKYETNVVEPSFSVLHKLSQALKNNGKTTCIWRSGRKTITNSKTLDSLG
jgi:transcriptional regulator with XRE-family HTH domain